MGKRLFDAVVGAVLLVATAPLVAVAAVAVAVSLRAWPFFVQERVGFRGRPFKIVKLRTLPTGAPRYADKYALADIAVPWLPRTLRTLHLDELPQLVHVVTGRMSLVGPRPEMRHLATLLDDGVRRDRERFRPGCTGLWQISRDAGRLIAEAPAYDRFYASYASLRLDAYILARTAAVIIWPRLRIVLDEVPGWALRQPAVRTGAGIGRREAVVMTDEAELVLSLRGEAGEPVNAGHPSGDRRLT